MVYSEWKWYSLFVTIILCILVLYSMNLLISIINLSFLSLSWIYMKVTMLSWQLYFPLYTFINSHVYRCICTFWLTVLPRRCSMMLKQSGHVSHLCLSSDFKGNASNVSLLSMMFDVVYPIFNICRQSKETSFYLWIAENSCYCQFYCWLVVSIFVGLFLLNSLW